MSIETQTAIVFYAPTKGRRYFSKQAAFRAEATAIILKDHPPFYGDGKNPPEDVRFDNPEWFAKEHKRIVEELKMARDFGKATHHDHQTTQ